MGSEEVKLKVSVTVDEELMAWIDEKVKRGIYASRSHAIRFALLELMKANKSRG